MSTENTNEYSEEYELLGTLTRHPRGESFFEKNPLEEMEIEADPNSPTEFSPGTIEKIYVMMKRYESGNPLFMDGDRVDNSSGCSRGIASLTIGKPRLKMI